MNSFKLIGKVILQPKNIVTGPEFKPLYKSYGHMPDEYERTRALDHVINHMICFSMINKNKIGSEIETYR